MRSSTLRVCSRMSLPTSPVTGCRPVWPATKTRLPNRVAADRFGFGAADPTVMISFLGMSFSLLSSRLGAQAPGDRISQQGEERVGLPGAAEGERRLVERIDGAA